MPATLSKPLAENFGTLNLPLGGKNGYVGVRKAKNGGFQGYTPKKSKGHTTGRYDTAQEAAVALAIKRQEIALGLGCDGGKKPRRQRMKAAAARWRHILCLSRTPLTSFCRILPAAATATQPKVKPSKALKLQTAFDSPLTGILPLRTAPRIAPAPLVPARPLTFEQAALLLALGCKHVRALPLA